MIKWVFVGYSFLGLFAATCAAVLVNSLWFSPRSCAAATGEQIVAVQSAPAAAPATQQATTAPALSQHRPARQIIVIQGNDEQTVTVPAVPVRPTRAQAATR